MGVTTTDIKDLISQNKNKVLNILIFVVAIYFAHNIYKNQVKELVSLNEKKDTESKKNVVLKEIRQSERKIFAYKEVINNKDISLTISTLNNMAKEFSVNILSIRPLPEKDYPIYIESPFNLKLEFNDYHTIGKFVSNLESHPNVYNVEVAGIAPEATQPGAEINKFSVDLKVSTILLKD